VVVLAPLARAGYVLRYDMVFVPRQPLRWDLLAPGGTLPRAVPQDALVSLSALVAPGWLVQRLVLAGLLAAAAIGAGRLVPARRGLTRVVAAIGYAWTPFLAERLLIGQWGLLVCYAAMPWLIRAARDVRLGRPGAVRPGHPPTARPGPARGDGCARSVVQPRRVRRDATPGSLIRTGSTRGDATPGPLDRTGSLCAGAGWCCRSRLSR